MRSLRRTLLLLAVAAVTAAPAMSRADGVDDALETARQANLAGDFAGARAIYEKLASEGRPVGMMNLGLLHLNGSGVPRDRERACDLFEQASHLGLAEAQALSGDCYYKGQGRPVDHAKSKFWYELAVADNATQAFCPLGHHFIGGLGGVLDVERGMTLCTRAAARGDAEAQTDLAQFFIAGKVVEQSYPEAFTWLTKAAAQGHPRASYLLGLMYWNGHGTEKDLHAAARHFAAAATRQVPEAPLKLGRYFYLAALDVEHRKIKDDPALRALFWCKIASKVDPGAEERAEAQKMLDAILAAAPHLKPKLEQLLPG